MDIRLVQHVEELEQIEAAWNDLLSRAHGATPFQSHLYHRVWWSTLGGGEWDQGQLRIYAGYDETDRLVGLAPFFQVNPEIKELRLIGSLEISDYLDLILDPDHAEEFVGALLARISKGEPDGPFHLILDNLLEDSPSVQMLESAAMNVGWRYEQERLQPAPLLDLPAAMDDYLQLLESKQRREFKRKMRRAADYPASVTWRIEDTPERITQGIEIFLDLMSTDADKRSFLTDPMKEHFRRLAREACEAGWLHLAFLEVSDAPVFGYLNFITQNRLWIYNSGFDPDHFALSPGWVLMGYLIDWAIERGLSSIDFMRGDEEYKYRLGGADRFVCRLNIGS